MRTPTGVLTPAEARLNLLTLFARLLTAEVDEHLYDVLAGQAAMLDPALTELGRKRVLTELAVEYCRLFVGPQPLCVPYASAYGSRATRENFDKLVAGEDLTIRPGPGPTPVATDHFGSVLAVLSHLCANSRRDAARHLIDEVLRPELNRFAEILRSSAELAPYITMSGMIVPLVEQVHSNI